MELGHGHVHKGLGCTGWGLAVCLGIGGLGAWLLEVGWRMGCVEWGRSPPGRTRCIVKGLEVWGW